MVVNAKNSSKPEVENKATPKAATTITIKTVYFSPTAIGMLMISETNRRNSWLSNASTNGLGFMIDSTNIVNK